MAGLIPDIEPIERVVGCGDRDRIVGVIDALKYFDDGESGFGFLRRHRSEHANGREFHVHFRARRRGRVFTRPGNSTGTSDALPQATRRRRSPSRRSR